MGRIGDLLMHADLFRGDILSMAGKQISGDTGTLFDYLTVLYRIPMLLVLGGLVSLGRYVV